MLQVVNPIKNALQQGWKNLPKKRIASFVGMFLFCAVATYASSKGAGGFTKATTEISSYQTPVANLMKAIAAVIVLVGAFNVYFKMQNGDQDVKKTIRRLFPCSSSKAGRDRRRCPRHRLSTAGHFLPLFSRDTIMQGNYNGYPVFKGLQRPLEFMGIRGRFLSYAAGAIGLSFIGFIVFSILIGKLAGFIAMIVLAIAGLITIYVKQRSGLHAKRHDRGIFVYQGLYNH